MPGCGEGVFVERGKGGVISVDQRNQVVREIARRTGSLQRRALSVANFGSSASLSSLGMGMQ